jgi:hypothetical protein
VTLQKQEESLLIIKLFIVVDLVFVDVFVELTELLALILIMLDLTIIEEAASLLTLLSFFLFF